MAISSAIQLADLALVWDAELLVGDLAMIDADLATDRGLETAVLLSLFTDRRAERDDRPPSGEATDRRGWWADQFYPNSADRIGSRLWLLDRSKRTGETALRAKEYILEALAWLREDRVVAAIEVETTLTTNALLIVIGLQRPGRDPVTFRYQHVWQHVQEDS